MSGQALSVASHLHWPLSFCSGHNALLAQPLPPPSRCRYGTSDAGFSGLGGASLEVQT